MFENFNGVRYVVHHGQKYGTFDARYLFIGWSVIIILQDNTLYQPDLRRYLNFKRPPLWSSGQSSWLQIRRPGFDSRHYQKKVVDLERGPLSLVSTTEELLDGKVAAPVYKTENTAVGIRHADHVTPSIRKTLAITSPTSGGRSVGIVLSRTQTMEFFFCFF
jgi:hypothetical protein